MCKHILFNDFKPSDLETLQLFSALSTNERCGFGAMIRNTDGEIETMKALDQGVFYIALTKRIMEGSIQTLVVHHRTSTNKDGLEYAHPFEFQGNYLTHNGVVTVPGEHKTQTENDSEALLHHLIKTGFDTVSIRGYFSCFIMNGNETIVLVDGTAPMHTDGRVYSSHKMADDFTKIEFTKLSLCPWSGKVMDKTEIMVTESTFGRESSLKSLGWSMTNDAEWSGYPSDDYYSRNMEYDADEYETRITDGARDFFDLVTDNEIEWLATIHDDTQFKDAIVEIGYTMGLDLTNKDVSYIVRFVDTKLAS